MRRILLPAALLSTALLLTGCSVGMSGASSDKSQQQAPVTTDGGAAPEAMLSQAGDAAPTVDRSVITTGSVSVKVSSPADAAGEAVRITEQSGGRVDGRSEYAPQGDGTGGSASLTLRIPADKLTAVLEQLKALGEVQEVSLNATDVTVEVQDLDARIRALQASYDRLLGLLATATDTETLITLETAISDRQAQLESLQAQQRYYADQVSMSTITLNLVTERTVADPRPSNFVDALLVGIGSLGTFFAGLVIVLGVLLPWLVIGAIVTAAVVLIVRRIRARTATPRPTPDT